MKPAAELVAGYATAPSTTITALTLSDSAVTLTTRGQPGVTVAYLLPPWADSQATGVLRLMAPSWHDFNNGLYLQTVASEVRALAPLGWKQTLQGQEAISAGISGSATVGDLEMGVLPILYDNLEGIDPTYIGVTELFERSLGQVIGIPNTITTGTAGAWASEAINSEVDNFKSDIDYAVLGYLTNTECLAVAFQGIATGNLRWGGPGNDTEKEFTANYFVTMTQIYGRPLIPVFHGSDKGNFNVCAVIDENGADPVITTLLAPIRRIS